MTSTTEPTAGLARPAGDALLQARRRDVERRRRQVHEALRALLASGDEITLSSVARHARVHRSFLHRHPDLRADVIAAADTPPAGLPSSNASVSRRSLQAENLNLRETNQRLRQHISDLEERLSELLGEQVATRSGLGTATSHTQLKGQVEALEQTVADLRGTLADRQDELDAARHANRQLLTSLNRPLPPISSPE